MWQITIEQAFSIKSYKWYLLKSFFLLLRVSYRRFHEFFFRDFLLCKCVLGSTICRFILISTFKHFFSYTLSQSVKTFCLFSQIHSVCISKHMFMSMHTFVGAYFSILKVPKRKNRFRLSGFIFHFSPSNSAL